MSNGIKVTRRMIMRRVLYPPFITILLVCGVMVYYLTMNLQTQVAGRLSRITASHQTLIEQFLSEKAADLEFIAATCDYQELARHERLAEIFANLQKNFPAFQDLGVFDAQGNHVAYVGPFNLEGKNYAQTEWFKAIQHQEVYVSDVFLGYRNVPHFVLVVRREEQGRPWYLRATIDPAFFSRLVESIRIGETGEAYLVNDQGQLQSPRRSGGVLMEVDSDRFLYRAGPEVLSSSARDHAGRRWLYAVARLSRTGWLLVLRQELSDAYAPLIHAVIVVLLIMGVGGAGVMTLAFMLASALSNRLANADLERQRLSDQLIMAGKLASIGEMSAGFAHEINNPLQVIRSEQTLIGDLLEDFQKTGQPPGKEELSLIQDSVEQIYLQVERCKKITQELLKFARRTEPAIQEIVLSEFIPEVVDLIVRQARLENIRVVQDLEPGLPPLKSDPNMLQQVLLNLLNNANYAVRDRETPEIRILAAKANSWITIAVSDNGPGIPADHLDKIFLPFFTTKPVGQGTGLGLSTSYGIVERLGGELTVRSEAGRGTVFTARLPLAGPPGLTRVPPAEQNKEARNDETHPSLAGGR